MCSQDLRKALVTDGPHHHHQQQPASFNFTAFPGLFVAVSSVLLTLLVALPLLRARNPLLREPFP